MTSAEIVRAWRDNIEKEARAYRYGKFLDEPAAPALIVVGGKVLYWYEFMSNLAYAVEHSGGEQSR